MRSKNLLIFFVPPEKVVNGGIISIFSQCSESRAFYNLHESRSVICTYPGNGTYGHNDLFANREKIYSFDEIISKWPKLSNAMFHIPETAVRIVSKVLRNNYSDYIENITDLHINVMTQNIDLVRSPAEFAELFRFTPNITQTTAHQRYTIQTLSNTYQTPVHHMSVFVDQSQYGHLPYEKKENLILYSPDKHPDKERVLQAINVIPGFRSQEIQDLTYEAYKDLTCRAKFCLSFGEGFDGYFAESYLSGSIGLAVYNDRFFPSEEFLSLPSVLKSYNTLAQKIQAIVLRLDKKQEFEECSRRGALMITKLYGHEIYIKKMKRFYGGDYDLMPEPRTAYPLIKALIESKDEALKYQEHKYRATILKMQQNARERKKAPATYLIRKIRQLLLPRK